MAAAYEPPVTDEKGPLIIRPSWRALGCVSMTVLALLVPVSLAAGLALFGRSQRLSSYAAGLGLIALVLAVYVLNLIGYMLGTRITVTADAIRFQHWFWFTATVDPRQIARVVRCTVRLPNGAKSATRPLQSAVFALAPTGQCVMSLYADRWAPTDLERIWRHLGITPEGSYEDVVDDEALSDRFPRSF
jgi:hypothetical protein